VRTVLLGKLGLNRPGFGDCCRLRRRLGGASPLAGGALLPLVGARGHPGSGRGEPPVVVQEWVEAERLRPVRVDPNRCELG
jgi:hypothetical protein